MCFISGKEKMCKLRVHETGGGPAPPALTPVEQSVWRILGKTPGFIGVTDRKSDSKIVLKKSKNTNDIQARICNATVTGETTGLTRAMNTSELLLISYIIDNLCLKLQFTCKITFMLTIVCLLQLLYSTLIT